jgi:hypothetical protein
MFKLPVFQTTMDTYFHMFHNLKQFFMLSWFWIAVLTLMGFVQFHMMGGMGESANSMFSMLIFLVTVMAFTSFSVAWMRFTITDQHHEHHFYAEFGKREFRYIFQGMLLVFIWTFFFGLLAFFLNFFFGAGMADMFHNFTLSHFFSNFSMMGGSPVVMQPETMGMTMSVQDMTTFSFAHFNGGYLGTFLGFVYFVFFVAFAMYMMRLKMVLPATATDHNMDIVCAWEFAKGHGMRLFFILLCTMIPYTFISGFVINFMASMQGNMLVSTFFRVIEMALRFGWLALYAGFLAHAFKAIHAHGGKDHCCDDHHKCADKCK